ncbi:ead/Ea22-like family protein [Klebsiella pneumoniae]|uniref:ead/Ea22-like family protein n=1 Tax=Klebsiella pneumoniae TaxID=573 RepID=UPI0035A8380F
MTFKKLTQAEKNKIRRKAMEAITDENYGDDGDNFHEHATAQAVISLLDELELKTEQRANWCAMAKKLGEDLDAAEKRIAELSASHGKLREAMAGIHNTISGGGAYTPLAAILNASKCAYEESAAAAGKGE